MWTEENVAQIRQRIDGLLARQGRVILAIDGKCASGKTTLADLLAEGYDCNVFRMDDFFLRPEQRTRERFAQVGGNVDHERFRAEVLEPLLTGQSFAFRPFDCQTMTLSAPVSVEPKPLTIVEGSYSMHPVFGAPYDLRILLTVPEDVQRQRILGRPAFLHDRFFTQWIPMENRYLEVFQIEQKADLIL